MANEDQREKTLQWKVGTTVFAALFIIALGILITDSTEDKVAGQTTRSPPIEISIDDDPILGDEDAPVTMIEFADFQCPSCKQFWTETFPLIKQQYITTGKVRFVFRDYPLKEIGHMWSVKAAEAAECAHDQGKFWEMYDKIFEDQEMLSSLVREVQHPEEATTLVTVIENGKTKYFDISLVVNHFKLLSANLRLDKGKFNECVDADKKMTEVEKDKADAEKAGVNSAPTFFINEKQIKGSLPLEQYQKIIERELFI